ncbi:uncharacterized protein LOC142564711 isoform X1 [Dermacentor variabilis]|uniref:uncharacterized protein LOC142564711 isoform X1 n=1 Tax=Dermacentor variabilis TaxID=34621 RepID=UPI003F5C6422
MGMLVHAQMPTVTFTGRTWRPQPPDREVNMAPPQQQPRFCLNRGSLQHPPAGAAVYRRRARSALRRETTPTPCFCLPRDVSRLATAATGGRKKSAARLMPGKTCAHKYTAQEPHSAGAASRDKPSSAASNMAGGATAGRIRTSSPA